MDIEELIVRAARHQATVAELEALREWRRQSPENERSYQEILALVETVNELYPQEESKPPSARDIIARAERVVPIESGPRAPARRGGRVVAFASGAAAAAAVLIFGLAIADRLPDGFLGIRSGPAIVYETASTESRTLQLADGTLVHLAASSRLEVVETTPNLELMLDGHAFFGVPRRDGRQVIVETSGGRVTVLGTRFDVHTLDGQLELLVVDGRVAVGLPERSVEIAAGIRSVVRQNVVSAVEQVDPLEHLDWMGMAMVFQATPLDRVVAEIERRYGVDIEILTPGIQDRTLTTAFDGESIDEVVNIVCRVVQAECEWTDNRVQISA